jgi:hypothetical protein
MSFAKYPVSGGGGSGDVAGPAFATNNGVVLFDGTTGKAIKDLGVGSANQVLLTNGTIPSFGAITNAYIDSSAAIAFSKMAALTADRAIISNGSGVIAVSSVTSTELGYLSGVTSAIQTQLNGKVGTTGDETIAGSKTFSSAVAITATSNQLILGTTNTATISASAPAASRVYTIADPGQSASFVMDRGTQTLQGTYTFTQQTMSQNVGSTTSALYAIVSSGTNPQLYNQYQSTAQTWRAGLNVDGSNVGSYVIYDSTATLPRAIVTTSGQFQLPATSNQILLSTGVNQLTLNSGTSAAARTYTVPDTGTTDTFAMLGGAQAFTALKTFNSGLTLNGGSAANLSIWSASNVLRQRGGTSGWAVDNTSGNAILSATDAGTFTLGVAGTNHDHTFNGNVFNHINSAARSVIQVESTSTAANADAFISHKVNGDSNYWSTGLDRSADAFVLTRGANRDVSTDTSLISVSSTGAVTLGPSSGLTSGHTLQASNSSSESSTVLIYNRVAADSAVFGLRIRKTANDSTTAQRFIGFSINDGATNSGQINANGASSAAFGTFSDRRLKENIENLPNQLNNILALRPVEFDYIAGGHQIGFIAQEMQVVYPDVVSPADSDGMLTITGWDKTSARIVKALQELAAKNDELEARLAALKAS